MDLFKTVIDEFNQKAIVEFYSKNQNLLPAEQYLCNKYLKRKGKVLVVGCGAGREAIALAKNGFKIVGIDIAKNMIVEAKRKAEELGLPAVFLQSDLRQLPFKEFSFDCIVMFGLVIQCIPQRQDRIMALIQIKSFLRPNGILLINFFRYSFFLGLMLNLYLDWVFKEQALDRYYRFKTISLRILRARLFTFYLRIGCFLRKEYYPQLESGDLLWNGDEVSGNKSFFHLYTLEEMLEDINNAGYKILDSQYHDDVEGQRRDLSIIKKGSRGVYFALQ